MILSTKQFLFSSGVPLVDEKPVSSSTKLRYISTALARQAGSVSICCQSRSSPRSSIAAEALDRILQSVSKSTLLCQPGEIHHTSTPKYDMPWPKQILAQT